MSSAGHIMDMINKIRYNSSLRTSYKSRYARIKEAYQKELGSKQVTYVRKTNISKKDLEDVRQIIRRKLKREQRNAFIKTIVLFTIVTAFMAYLVYKYIIMNPGLVS